MESFSSSTLARRTASRRPNLNCSKSANYPATFQSLFWPTSRIFQVRWTCLKSSHFWASKNSARVPTGTYSRRVPSPVKGLMKGSQSCTSSFWIEENWLEMESVKMGSANNQRRRRPMLQKIREKCRDLIVITTEIFCSKIYCRICFKIRPKIVISTYYSTYSRIKTKYKKTRNKNLSVTYRNLALQWSVICLKKVSEKNSIAVKICHFYFAVENLSF